MSSENNFETRWSRSNGTEIKASHSCAESQMMPHGVFQIEDDSAPNPLWVLASIYPVAEECGGGSMSTWIRIAVCPFCGARLDDWSPLSQLVRQ